MKSYLGHPARELEWLVVLDESECEIIPFVPESASLPTHQTGLLQLRQVSAAVPALAWALSEATMTDFMVVAWAKVLKMPREMFSSPACLARQMLTTLLDGRADAAEYLAKFDSRGVKSTTRVAQATEDRSRAALQNVDADNIEVMLKNMERTYRPGPFDQDRDGSLVSRPACPVPEGRAPPTAPVRGTEGWMSFFCPGAGKVEGMGEIAVNKWVERLSWIAIYRHPEDLGPLLKPGHRQMTKSQKWRRVPATQQTNSCHQALAFVLKWQWSKHLAITDIQPADAIRVFCERYGRSFAPRPRSHFGSSHFGSSRLRSYPAPPGWVFAQCR